MNKSLIETIKDEIMRCDGEIRRADFEMKRLQERLMNYDDRKVMLTELFEKAEQEAKERDNHD